MDIGKNALKIGENKLRVMNVLPVVFNITERAYHIIITARTAVLLWIAKKEGELWKKSMIP